MPSRLAEIGRKNPALSGPWAWVGLLSALAVLLRLVGLDYGLPQVFNSDEPHLVNLAVSFGGGSLRPYLFKYPTLWPYVLFFSYGMYFLAWSAFGLRHTVSDFVGLFAWDPSGFYLLGRLLASIFSLLGVWVVWRTCRLRQAAAWPWAALLLFFSPVIVELAHSCKPDCLMFFLAALGWYFGLRLYFQGDRRSYWACGAFFGLAVSTQYTALPALVLLPLAHFLGQRPGPRRWLGEGLAAAAAGFFLGSPYILVDLGRFGDNLRDMAHYNALLPLDRPEVIRQILRNLWSFSGGGSLAGAAALLGLGRLLATRRRLAAVLVGPILVDALILSRSPDGGWARYLLGCFPGLALLAAEGLAWAASWRKGFWPFFLAGGALLPGLMESGQYVRSLRLADTRSASTAWMLEHVPQGSVVLLDLPHASPRLPMIREQVEQLALRTRQAGSPRRRLFEGMAAAHPGGGYRIYRVQRSAKDLHSYPQHVQLSQADDFFLELRSGIAPARALGVEYVVTSTFGATPQRAPELSVFFAQLESSARLVKSWEPAPGKTVGPFLRLYRLQPPPAASGRG
ncbi:MAG TPA: hypothetical protein DEB40_14105 [Elusimicrobia bacterium]|nr:hypothetical protein [Elusimicrobiota bacterium]HBT62865.1 hypothetical protein [Elusimicrobiota bacterium]